MFGLDSTVLAFVALATLSVGALAYALLFTSIENEKKAGKRLETIKRADTDRATIKASRDRIAEAAKRRKSVQDSLKELESKQKARAANTRKPPLKMQLRQAGLDIPMQRFYLYSAICGLALTALLFIAGTPLLVLPGAFVAGVFGVPRWFISFKRGRRVKAFLQEFPADRLGISRAGERRVSSGGRIPAARAVAAGSRDAHA
jgi:tight adherence protein B